MSYLKSELSLRIPDMTLNIIRKKYDDAADDLAKIKTYFVDIKEYAREIQATEPENKERTAFWKAEIAYLEMYIEYLKLVVARGERDIAEGKRNKDKPTEHGERFDLF